MPFNFNFNQIFNNTLGLFNGGFMGGGFMGGDLGSGFINSLWGPGFINGSFDSNHFMMPYNFSNTGGFNNSLWGTGFQNTSMYSGNVGWGGGVSVSSSAKTPEERAQDKIDRNKFNSLKSIIKEWIDKDIRAAANSDSAKGVILIEFEDAGKSYSKENYEKLKTIYNNNKTAIQSAAQKHSDIKPKTAAINAANDFTKTTPQIESFIYNLENSGGTVSIKCNVDAMEFIYQLNNQNKSFQEIFNEQCANAKDSATREKLQNVLKALCGNLQEKITTILDGKSNISSETKEKLNSLKDIDYRYVDAAQIEQLYYWLRIAYAEIDDNEYGVLAQDFPGEDFFKSSNVDAVKAHMKVSENIDVDAISSQSVYTNLSTRTSNLEKMTSLANSGYLRELNATEIDKLKTATSNISNFEKGKVWVDKTKTLNDGYAIRFIDNNGKVKLLSGCVMKPDGTIATLGTCAVNESPSPEKIKEQADNIAQIEAYGREGLFYEITPRDGLTDPRFKEYNGKRIICEMVFRVSANEGEQCKFPKYYYINDEGKLVEIKNIFYGTSGTNSSKIWRTLTGKTITTGSPRDASQVALEITQARAGGEYPIPDWTINMK